MSKVIIEGDKDGGHKESYFVPTDEDSMIEFLEGERIVSFSKHLQGIMVIEQCDNYFQALLTKEQFLQFIKELTELSESI